MNVASLELCKDLYELSGWGYTYHAFGVGEHDLTDKQWYWFEGKRTGSYWEAIKADWYDRDPFDGRRPTATTHRMDLLAPAYDLGYLLRKLPQVHISQQPSHWAAWCVSEATANIDTICGDTPEDAAAKLAIELFKQGVFTRDSVTSSSRRQERQ